MKDCGMVMVKKKANLVPLGLSPSESGFWKGDTHMPAISKK